MSARTRELVQTRTGILIGSAHVEKPPEQSRDADLIQKALLADSTWFDRFYEWFDSLWPVWAALAIAIGVTMAVLHRGTP